ncbi:hypothetical protein KCP77_22460 [Salmonella enterica subsp. enterica]|nr:hypothetical protein KCP77_22460 [Salmonella enterica subsp. enterica]
MAIFNHAGQKPEGVRAKNLAYWQSAASGSAGHLTMRLIATPRHVPLCHRFDNADVGAVVETDEGKTRLSPMMHRASRSLPIATR